MDTLRSVHDQLKHAIVLLSESVKLNMPQIVRSKNMHEAKAVQLSQQMSVLEKWACSGSAEPTPETLLTSQVGEAK